MSRFPFYTLCKILHSKTCTKCSDVVLQSVQKFFFSDRQELCLMSGNETNLPGRKSCPSMYTRHLHVPLGLCGNRKKKKSGLGDGPFRLKWVKIWFVPKTRSQANPIKPRHPRRPSSLFRLENKLSFGGTTPCYTSQLKICIPPNKITEKTQNA